MFEVLEPEVKSMEKKVAKFTPEQLKFIKHTGTDSVILRATAGSGKTASATGRLKYLLNKRVRPDKIIFFSFTNDAVNELRARIGNKKVEITTIHSFCLRVLAKSKKFKKIADFYHFIAWFKKKYKPTAKATVEERLRYRRLCDKLDNEPEYHASQISKYKILKFENTKSLLPDFYNAYTKFLIETRSRDFVDMLIEVYNMTKNGNKTWEKEWQYKYDYVFVDEYQDTSSVQMKILLDLKAKIYHLIGDRNQSIYGFSGANALMIEKLLKQAKPTVEYKLSVNFRSDNHIVNHSNNFSDLEAVAHSKNDGKINFNIINEVDAMNLAKQKDVVILARTNSVIKDLELLFLSKRVPMRYFNLITPEELEIIKSGKALSPKLNSKLKRILPKLGKAREVVKFIEDNKNSNSFITSIHKSKGREFPHVIVVNSISPTVLELNKLDPTDKELKKVTFNPEDIEDQESKNVHYVALTRPKHELYFMIYHDDKLD